MFKLAALLCVVAAAATAPPRISLDLDAITKMGQASLTQHKDASKQPHSQDFTERCPAGASTDNTNCPFPAAKAYDHHDKEVQVKTRVYLVDADGKTANRRVGSVDFTKRSTYLFKYDATDAAGNKASQVVFALILDDTTKPTITTCGGEAETVEAATAWKLCKSSATDNIDGMITKAIKYTVKKVGGSVLVKDGSYAQAVQKLHTKQTGQFLITMKVSDNAIGARPSGCREDLVVVNLRNHCAPLNAKSCLGLAAPLVLEHPREVVQAPSGRYLRSVNDGPRFVVAVVLDLIEHGVREVWRGGGLAVFSRRAGGVRPERVSHWVWIAVAPRLRGRDGGGGRLDDGRVCGWSGHLAGWLSTLGALAAATVPSRAHPTRAPGRGPL